MGTPNSQTVVGATPRQKEGLWEINSSSDAFGNAPGMLSALCSGFRGQLLFVG
jgi:hypothetical protein